MLRTTPLMCLLALFLTSCSDTGAEPAYNAPNWTRGFCTSIDWSRQGRSDAARFEDPERRLAALERSCGIHMQVPREEYLAGFAAGR